jgi:predicted RNA binding protein YcfA (HicA-like mRNA interferase family)
MMAASARLDESPPVRPPGKLGVNSPCWCGSGRKYKKCHRAADEEAERAARAAVTPTGSHLCDHDGQRCYLYLPPPSRHRAVGRLDFTEAVHRMVRDGLTVFHFFRTGDLGRTPGDYKLALDKLRSYGIRPYLNLDPDIAELRYGQACLDILFGSSVARLLPAGDSLEATRYATWIAPGSLDEGTLEVYWNGEYEFSSVISRVQDAVEGRRGDFPDLDPLEVAAFNQATCLRLVLKQQRSLNAARLALIAQMPAAAEALWLPEDLVYDMLPAPAAREANALSTPGSGLEYGDLVLALALGAEVRADWEALAKRYRLTADLAEEFQDRLARICAAGSLDRELKSLKRRAKQRTPWPACHKGAPPIVTAQPVVTSGSPSGSGVELKPAPPPTPSEQPASARRPAKPAAAPHGRVTVRGPVWRRLEEAAESVRHESLDVQEQELVLLDQRRELEEEIRLLRGRVQALDDQILQLRKRQTETPRRQITVGASALTAALAEPPDAAKPLLVAVSSRFEESIARLAFALPGDGRDVHTCYPGKPLWAIISALAESLAHWADAAGLSHGEAAVACQPAAGWTALMFELPPRVGCADPPANAGDFVEGFAESMARLIPEGLDIELCPVASEILSYALAADTRTPHDVSSCSLSPAGAKLEAWTTTACAMLSVTPVELAAHLAMLGYRGRDLDLLHAGLASVAQRLGRLLTQPSADPPASETPGVQEDQRPGRYRLTRNVSPEQAIRALEREGWRHDRTSGDHAILEKAGSPTRIVLPLARHHLSTGRLLGLIREANLTEQQFAALLQG